MTRTDSCGHISNLDRKISKETVYVDVFLFPGFKIMALTAELNSRCFY